LKLLAFFIRSSLISQSNCPVFVSDIVRYQRVHPYTGWSALDTGPPSSSGISYSVADPKQKLRIRIRPEVSFGSGSDHFDSGFGSWISECLLFFRMDSDDDMFAECDPPSQPISLSPASSHEFYLPSPVFRDSTSKVPPSPSVIFF
jgi:hypothetical protein